MPPLAMSKKGCIRRELLDRWSAIQEEEDDSLPSSERRVLRVKEEWFDIPPFSFILLIFYFDSLHYTLLLLGFLGGEFSPTSQVVVFSMIV